MATASELGAGDPLAGLVGAFTRPDPHLVYLDGNSLGRPPVATAPAVAAAVETWSGDLVTAWDRWIDLALTVGDALGPVLGAGPGQVTVGDSTTVCLHRAVGAAVAHRPERAIVVACADDFPTDRYVVAAVAGQLGRHVRWVPSADQLTGAIDGDVAVVVASAVHFGTAQLAEVAAVTDVAHANGAVICWDLSHASGAVPLHLDDWDVDLAVGCTYKYLHGGPGAPAFTYVARRLLGTMDQPIHGWFGQRDQFAMGPEYVPGDGIGSWRAGTPAILSLVAAEVGIRTVAAVDPLKIRAKSLALGRLMIDRWHEDLEPLGVSLASPADDDRRGGHVALRHPEASRIVRAARRAGVIADFRGPDLVRLGPGPLASTFAEVDRGMDVVAAVVRTRSYEAEDATPGRVT